MKTTAKVLLTALALTFALAGCCRHHHGPMNCAKPGCPNPCPMAQPAATAAQ